jgi:hypothetical protein
VLRRLPAGWLELVVVAWIAAWNGIGYLVDRQVRGIGDLGDTVVLAGGALRQTAHALDGLSGVPFVGERIGRIARDARRTAQSAVVNGRAAGGDVDRLAVLLWLTVAAAPALPVAWYVSVRFRSRR